MTQNLGRVVAETVRSLLRSEKKKISNHRKLAEF